MTQNKQSKNANKTSFRLSINAWLPTLLLGACLATSLALEAPAQTQNYEAARIYNQGLEQYKKGNTRAALDLFDTAIRVDPSYQDAYYNSGTIHFKEKRYPQAESAFRRAIELNPRDDQAKFSLGLVYERQGKKAEAQNILRFITPQDPNYLAAQDLLKKLNGGQEFKAPSARHVQNGSGQASLQVSPAKLSVDTVAKGFFGPTGMAVGEDGSLFVANYSKHSIYKVDGKGKKIVFAQDKGLKGPVGLVYNPALREFYVANYLGNTISRISLNGKVTTLASGLKKPYYLMLDAIHNALYISEQESNTVSRIRLKPRF